MRNLRLKVEGGASLQVDELNLRLKSDALRTHSSRALLKSGVEWSGAKGSDLILDGKSISSADCVIGLWYDARERQSRITCKVGKHVYEPQRILSLTEVDSSPARIDKGTLQGKVELVSKEGIEGKYRFRLDRETADLLDRRLTWASSKGRFKYEKGGLAEDLCASILEAAGWEEVRRHPLSTRFSYM
ncbi:MAG: hypothetical protein JRN08_08045, partial [Nitrososphaerota archaeon]|nr:hypothetical protein [Nitrososphaerota archaeon]